MAEDDPVRSGTAPPAGAGAPDPEAARAEGAGDFERYALIAALTLVVLCLLVWDNWQGAARPAAAPRTDRTLRVEIGGDPAPPRASRSTGEPRSVSIDAPPQTPPAPPPSPPERTYTVRSGDTLGEIAKRELGSSSRAADIAALNGIADPAKIREGQVLRLPAK